MKVALCFIISYEHVIQKEHYWIKWIESNKDLFNVYFHYKQKSKIKSRWILNYCIPEKYVKTTSYFNVVPAYMTLLTYAHEHDKNNQWFCMLTDTCVPIISPENFRKLFLNYYDKSIIRCGKAHWNINLHQRANLRHFSKEYHLYNDPWFTLCRYHVHLCILFMVGQNSFYNKINSGGLANESIFAIILQTFNELNKNKILNCSGTICDWIRMSNPTSPHLFNECTEVDKNIITTQLKINPYALFLRKVNYKFPDEKLIEISSWDVDINKPDINKQNINKQIVYKITQIKNYNVLALYFILFLFFTICFAKIFMNA
jgi:hypothetical protein